MTNSVAPVSASTNREPAKPTPTNGVVRSVSYNRTRLPETSNAPKVVPVEPIPPPANFETVKLAADPVIRAAQDVPRTSAPAETSDISEPIHQNSAPLVNTRKPEPAQRTFLQRINPFNLFKSEDKQGSATTPLPGSVERSQAQDVRASPGNPSGSAENIKGGPYAYNAFPQPVPGNRQEAQPLFDQAVRAQQAHRLAEAMRGYTQAVEKDPSFFEAYYNLGLTATEARDLPGALRAYEKALAARVDSLDARFNFALALKQANYLRDAANELEKVIAANPKEGRAHLALANLYAQQLNQPAKAREHYLLVLQSDPHNSEATAIRYWLTANPP